MPRLMTVVTGWPVCPRQAPERTRSLKSRIFPRTEFTSGMTSRPSTITGRFDRLRSAVCSTARFSVRLILSPANMRSIQPRRSASSARRASSAIVSSVTNCLE